MSITAILACSQPLFHLFSVFILTIAFSRALRAIELQKMAKPEAGRTAIWGDADADAGLDVGENSRESGQDADVFEVLREPVENPVDIEVDRVKMSQFVKEKISVLVHQIRNPSTSWRALDPVTFSSWKQVLKRDGYDGVLGSISVVLGSRARKEDTALSLLSLATSHTNLSLEPVEEFVVVDGRHRLEALREITSQQLTDGEHNANKIGSPPIEVTIWKRKDKRSVSALEQLVIAEYCNRTSGRVRKADFVDLVHAAVSTVTVLSKEFQVTPDRIRFSQLARAFKVAETVGEMSERNRERYAYIALNFARRPLCYQHFQNVCMRARVGMVHLYSRSLFCLSDDGFGLAMEVLERREHLKIRSSFVTVRDTIYSETNKMLTFVQDVAIKEKLRFSEVLEMEMGIYEQDKRSLRTFLVDSLAKISVPVGTNDKRENSSRSRFLSFSKQLAGLFHSRECPAERAREEELLKKSIENNANSPRSLLTARNETETDKETSHDDEMSTDIIEIRRSKRTRKLVQYHNTEGPQTFYPSQKKSRALKLVKDKSRDRHLHGHEIRAKSLDMRAALSSMTPQAISELFEGLDVGVKVTIMTAEAAPEAEKSFLNEEDRFESTEKGGVAISSDSSARVVSREGEEFVSSSGVFQDNMPSVLPHGLKSPTPYSGPQFPDWCH